MTRVTRFHLTSLMTAALPELITRGFAATQMGAESYAAAFVAAPTQGPTWTKPWGTHVNHHQYWSRMLGSGYMVASSDSAWRKQTPLCNTTGYVPGTTLEGLGVGCERYLYPSGVGIAVTVTVEDDLSLDEVKGLHRRLCQESVFLGSDGKPRSIRSVLSFELERLGESVLGAGSVVLVRDDQPTFVTTIAATSDPAASDDAAAFLTAICCPRQGSGGATVFPAPGGRLGGTIRVAGEDTLASWAPDLSFDERWHESLTCYHHNQVLSALLVASLLDLVDHGGDHPERGSDPAIQLYKQAGALLGWLYGGAKSSVYATPFAYAAIVGSGLVDRINHVRAWLPTEQGGGDPLHARHVLQGGQA